MTTATQELSPIEDTVLIEDAVDDLITLDEIVDDNDDEIIEDPRWLKYVAFAILGLVIIGAVLFAVSAIQMEIAELVLRERMDAKWELYEEIKNLKK